MVAAGVILANAAYKMRPSIIAGSTLLAQPLTWGLTLLRFPRSRGGFSNQA